MNDNKAFSAEDKKVLRSILDELATPILDSRPLPAQLLVHRRDGNAWRGEIQAVERRDAGAVMPSLELQKKAKAIIEAYRPNFFAQAIWRGDESARRWDPLNLLISATATAFELGADDARPDLDRAVARLEDQVFRSQAEIRVVGLLAGLSILGDVSPIEVSPGYVLRRIDEETYNHLYGGDIGTRTMFSSIPLWVTAVVETTATVRVGPEPEEGARDRLEAPIRRCIRALRILRPGRVDLVGVLSRFPGGVTPGAWSLTAPIAGTSTGPSMTINTGEETSVAQGLGLATGTLHPILDLAAERLSDASCRRSARDRLIDSVVGLEAILLVDNSEKHNELGYRFAMNYASFGTTFQEKETRFRKARRLYAGRSGAVHGNTKKFDTSMADDALEALREILLHFLPGGTKPTFLADGFWRQRVLGGSS